ncbi:MAG: hypothetical protein FNT15_09320, partial [Sulfurovum sp.]
MISLDKNSLFIKLFFIFVLFMILTPELFAATSGMPWEAPLEKVKSSLSGPVAGAIALIGVVAAGAGLIFGGQEMGPFMKTIVTLILVISLIMIFVALSFQSAILGLIIWFVFSSILRMMAKTDPLLSKIYKRQ